MIDYTTEACLVDTHNHLSLAADLVSAEDRLRRHNVRVIGVTNRPSEYRALLASVEGTSSVDLALGLHPEVAGSVYERHELKILGQYAREATWIAEVGLDGEFERTVAPFFGSIPTLEKQERLLAGILEVVGDGKRFSVHSRGAEERINQIFASVDAKLVVLHWYHGLRQTAKRALDLGFCFSINPAMVREGRCWPFLRWLPREAILLETDAPFVVWEGHDVEAVDIVLVVRELATIRGESPDELVTAILENQRARGI